MRKQVLKNISFFLVSLILLSACLDNLERSTNDTKMEVQESKMAILQTRDLIKALSDNQQLGFYVQLMSTNDNPNLRQFNIVQAMWEAPIDTLFVLFGASIDLGEETLEDGKTPNVTLVGSVSDPVLRLGGITPQMWNEEAAACKSSLSQIINYQAKKTTTPENLRLNPDRLWRSILACTAVAGALPQHALSDSDRAKTDWPRSDKDLVNYGKIRDDIEDLMKRASAAVVLSTDPKVDAERRLKMDTYIKIRMHNNLTLIPNIPVTPAQ